ncbi:hypothetical protein CDAR_519591 [Caerostris darwini]|uniref:Uncharacterized protein n=1 Tax=Caerostris darwini TaxID=1538125 RepID=A0AAV4TMA8_9ARAC|nr:hypothetical protein CDAR_519591 [Caerostris darwini]
MRLFVCQVLPKRSISKIRSSGAWVWDRLPRSQEGSLPSVHPLSSRKHPIRQAICPIRNSHVKGGVIHAYCCLDTSKRSPKHRAIIIKDTYTMGDAGAIFQADKKAP